MLYSLIASSTGGEIILEWIEVAALAIEVLAVSIIVVSIAFLTVRFLFRGFTRSHSGKN